MVDSAESKELLGVMRDAPVDWRAVANGNPKRAREEPATRRA
jgi:hypothetical protein